MRSRRGLRKEKRSHIFCAEYDFGYSQIICAFRNKPVGVRVMAMLNEALEFEELINGNVLGNLVFYFDTPLLEYDQDFPVFQFEKVRNRRQVDAEITEKANQLFLEHSRKYNDLNSVFTDDIRNAIIGKFTPEEDDGLRPQERARINRFVEEAPAHEKVPVQEEAPSPEGENG